MTVSHSAARGRNGSLLSALAVLGLALADEAPAGINRWTSQGPFSGTVFALTIDPLNPSTVYAGTLGHGVFKSLDGAENWQRASRGLSARFVACLKTDPFDPSVVYAATFDGGIFKSMDGASSWQSANSGIDSLSAGAIAVHPRSPSTLYAGTGSGIYLSADRGATWSLVKVTRDVHVLAIDHLDPSTVYAGTDSGLWKTTDGGGLWERLEVIDNDRGENRGIVLSMAMDPLDSEILYAGTRDYLFKSSDGGRTWMRAGFGLYGNLLNALAVDPASPSTLYAGYISGSGLFKSTDSGSSWVLSGPFHPTHGVNVIAIDPSSPATVYSGKSRTGVLKSTDAGGIWVSVNEGLIATYVGSLAVDPSNADVVYASVPARAQLFKSHDRGKSWFQPAGSEGLSVESMAVDPQNPSTIVAGGNRGMIKSVDGGASWVSVNDGFISRDVRAVVFDPLDSLTIYTATESGVYRTIDGGANWELVNYQLPILRDLAIDPLAPTTLYVATSSGVLKSVDAGETWTDSSTGLEADEVRSIIVDPGDPSTLYAGTMGAGVFKSVDAGRTWTSSGGGLPILHVSSMAIDPVQPAILYVGSFDEVGVYRSSDGGISWSEFNEGLSARAINALAIHSQNPSLLYAASQGGGVFELTQADRCVSGPSTLCIDDEPGDQRFEIRVAFHSALGGGAVGEAQARRLAPLGVPKGGIFRFLDPANPEILVKVLNGCALNDSFWVFLAATTSLGFEMMVTDTVAGVSRTYLNADASPAVAATDTEAFATCDAAAGRPGGRHFARVSPPSRGPRVATGEAEVAGFLKVRDPELHKSPRRARRQFRRTSEGWRPLSPVLSASEMCIDAGRVLCIDDQVGDRRFRVKARFSSTLGGGVHGEAQATPLGPLGFAKGGVFSFGDPSNPEVLLKVLNGCALNNHFWVFAGAATNLGFELTVEDTVTGASKSYTNPDRTPATPIIDTSAFATCGAQSGWQKARR